MPYLRYGTDRTLHVAAAVRSHHRGPNPPTRGPQAAASTDWLQLRALLEEGGSGGGDKRHAPRLVAALFKQAVSESKDGRLHIAVSRTRQAPGSFQTWGVIPRPASILSCH